MKYSNSQEEQVIGTDWHLAVLNVMKKIFKKCQLFGIEAKPLAHFVAFE